MRVTKEELRPNGAERRPAAPRFGAMLRKAAGRPPAEIERAVVRGPAVRRAALDRRDIAPCRRRDGFREEQRAVLPPAPQPPGAAEPGTPPAEIRGLVRALPVAIDASTLRAGTPLALAFGRSLEVELRAVPGGVELVLRADRRLALACTNGLPELVAALARRGIAVARAEVRPRGGTSAGAPR